jgi:anionic cell wall polymer biosynthesis LytR-Cps2A-Psr (LCP) family protein
LWCVIVFIAWWGGSALLPAVPSPWQAARSGLGLLKRGSDELYVRVFRKDLEKAQQQVLAAAEDVDARGGTDGAEDTMSAERRRRLPSVPIAEDSALRAQMKDLSSRPMIGGRVINIVLIGLDSRLNTHGGRADAVHLFTINPDSAVVDIMAIPRGTYVDLGYPDTTTFNIIANAYALGHQGFLKRIAELTKRGPVKYYAEVGFSQAMGILEMLGYKDPVGTLRFLRNRKGMATGDIQRSYNQASFLRQSLIGKFSLLTGATGDVLLSAGLRFLETNLTKEFCQGLVYALSQKSFPRHRSDAVRVRMLPMYRFRLKEMTADSATVARASQREEHYVGDDAVSVNVPNYLRKQLRQAAADSARPGKVVSRLWRLADQHAWLQIQDKSTRTGIRDSVVMLLSRAYRRMGNKTAAEEVEASRLAEEQLLRIPK